MARVTRGDLDVAMAAAFGRPSARVQEEMRQGLERFGNYMGNIAPHIVKRMTETYRHFNTGAFARRVQATRARLERHFQDETTIRPLLTIDDVQNAPAAMLDHIMAMPEIRKLYLSNRVSGYGERYHHPGEQIEWADRDYRRIMNGVVHEEQINGEARLVTRQFIERTPDEINLTVQDKSAILRTHNFIRKSMLDSLVDPTSEDNELMG